MLDIQSEEGLARLLHVPVGEIRSTANFVDQYVRKLTVWQPGSGKRPRDVIDVRGPLRHIQIQIDRLIKKRVEVAPFSHGGISNRSILTNALPHLGNEFFYSVDIADFFKSISISRVNSLFLRRLRCAPRVAHILTRLTTYDYHLALGLITSPILAELILEDVDHRINRFCVDQGNAYTRFVDDISISSRFDLKDSGIPSLIERILREHGFACKPPKDDPFGCATAGANLPGVRIRRGRIDVRVEYIEELERQLADHASLSRGEAFTGPLFGQSQLEGRVYHAAWINPGRRGVLKRKVRSLNWSRVWDEAARHSLIVSKKITTSREEAEKCSAESRFEPIEGFPFECGV